MQLARYWIRDTVTAGRIRVTARGWSNEDMEAARRQATVNAQRVADWIAAGKPGDKQHYLYGERPLPEPVEKEFSGGIVTRNSYGCQVLNTSNLMFIDIDRQEPEAPATGGGFLSSLFGGKKEPAPLAKPVLQGIAQTAGRTGLHGRVYETAAGYRVLIDNRPFEAASAEAEQILQQFGADPLYIRLCRMQESFRARLSPKPWRCQMYRPSVTFPFETVEQAQRNQAWMEKYQAKAENYATCRFVQEVGTGVPGLEPELVRFHDEATRAMSGLPLA